MAAVAGAVGAAVYYSMYNVEGGERAIIFNRLSGIRDEIKGEGTHCESSSGGGGGRGWKAEDGRWKVESGGGGHRPACFSFRVDALACLLACLIACLLLGCW